MTKDTSKDTATTVEGEDEAPVRVRVSAATVKDDALRVIQEAGDKGITLKDLGDALQAKGHYEGLDTKAVYRKVHNVTHWLEGRPPTGNKTFKPEPQYAERVSGKSYRVTDLGNEYLAQA